MVTSRELALQPNEIHLWFAHDEQIGDAELLDRYHQMLNDAESAQQRRFYFARHRHQYLITRALLRSVLSLYHPEVAPAAWVFEKNKYGKPAVAAPIQTPLRFNLSHTEKMIVLAVTLDIDLGVDVEWLQRRGQTVEIANHYFSPAEIAQLHALPPERRRDRFFDLWTLKEAYIKAWGMGLSIPLDHFSYLFSDEGRIRIEFVPEREDHPAQWRFWQMMPAASHKVALALKLPVHAPGVNHSLILRNIVPLQSAELIELPIIRHGG